jgi:hypothetical protein
MQASHSKVSATRARSLHLIDRVELNDWHPRITAITQTTAVIGPVLRDRRTRRRRAAALVYVPKEMSP